MEAIWPGSSSFSPGDTPYGFYDNEAQFNGSGVHSVDRFADWAGKRLGYPIVAIELQDKQFYACYEEAITEYSAQVNQFNIKDNLLSLQGQSTGSSVTHRKTTPTFGRAIELSEQYGTEAGVGGTISYKTGSINIVSGSQQYDLNKLWANVSESSKAIEIRKIHYEGSPAVTRYFDPYVGTGYASDQLLEGFGYGNYSPAVNFLMLPMYDDLLRVQAIEFNDTIRKSAYSFELRNNRLRVFPDPKSSYKIWIEYVLVSDRNDNLKNGNVQNTITDFSNATYDDMVYSNINHPGKQWIRKYTLALVKELLGNVRSKYSSIPIPGAEVNVDGDTLRSEAAVEKENLISQLREDLEASSRRNLLERQKEEAEFMGETMNKIPYGIYIG